MWNIHTGSFLLRQIWEWDAGSNVELLAEIIRGSVTKESDGDGEDTRHGSLVVLECQPTTNQTIYVSYLYPESLNDTVECNQFEGVCARHSVLF